MQFRQGDVFIEAVSAVPKDAKPMKFDAGRAVLAYGEVTGHAHAVVAEDVEMFRQAEDGTLYLQPKVDTQLRHEEHGAIDLKAGQVYRATRQREWTDADEPRFVAD